MLSPVASFPGPSHVLKARLICSVWMSNVVVYWPGERRKLRTFLQTMFFTGRVQFYLLCTKQLHNRAHMISPPRPSLSRSLACNIEEVGVAWGRGYTQCIIRLSTRSILAASPGLLRGEGRDDLVSTACARVNLSIKMSI